MAPVPVRRPKAAVPAADPPLAPPEPAPAAEQALATRVDAATPALQADRSADAAVPPEAAPARERKPSAAAAARRGPAQAAQSPEMDATDLRGLRYPARSVRHLAAEGL